MLGRLFSSLGLGLLLALCGISLAAFFASVASLPRLAVLAVELLRGLLKLSYYLYAAMLSRIQPISASVVGLDLLAPLPRTVCTMLFSLTAGYAVLTWLGWLVNFWWLGLFACHGLVVGVAWDSLVEPSSFQMGERIP
jgi:hypothetical protein